MILNPSNRTEADTQRSWQRMIAGQPARLRKLRGAPCLGCENRGYVIYAGDMNRDDGYCELRRCPTCSDGKRIGRSDVPICTESVEAAA